MPGWSSLGVGAQDLDVAPTGDVFLCARIGDRERTVEFCGVDDDIGAGELAELQAARGW